MTRKAAVELAQHFVESVVANRFAEARKLLTDEFAALATESWLADHMDDMLSSWDTDEPKTVTIDEGFVLTTWPTRPVSDVASVYVSIMGTSNVEAINVLVERRNDRLQIRELESGRP